MFLKNVRFSPREVPVPSPKPHFLAVERSTKQIAYSKALADDYYDSMLVAVSNDKLARF